MNQTEQKDLVTLFADKADEKQNKPFAWEKINGTWTPHSWTESANLTARIAKALKSNGIKAKDRVLLVSENRVEWPMADLAIMASGGITVPAYTTNTANDHLHVMNDSGAAIIIVSNTNLLNRVLPAAERADSVKLILLIEGSIPEITSKKKVLLLNDILSSELDNGTEVLRKFASELTSESIACLIYTSGTGGTPKGVICSHGGILSNCRDATRTLSKIGLTDEKFLSFLPLSHSYEHTAGLFWPISLGAQIFYAESIDKLIANIEEVKPTLMTAVPRLYETIRDRILRNIEKTGGMQKRLFLKCLQLGQKQFESGYLSPFQKLQDLFLEKLVRKKIAEKFGGNLKAFISGGAPLNYEVGMFFTGLGIRLLQGYGQTESGPVISVNPPTGFRIDTVGIPFSEAEVKIAEDGEILVKGALVMQGYWNNASATKDTIVDNWLHTGDIGTIDLDGHLRITDRKKDIIINSGGDNISPQRVEGYLVAEPEIHQAMVHGDARPHLVALLILDAEFLKAWAEKSLKYNENAESLFEDVNLKKEITKVVDRVNSKLSSIERIRSFIISNEEFTIENEMLTPTLKVRRHVIRNYYMNKLESLYG